MGFYTVANKVFQKTRVTVGPQLRPELFNH
jgi:hypothetical protein